MDSHWRPIVSETRPSLSDKWKRNFSRRRRANQVTFLYRFLLLQKLFRHFEKWTLNGENFEIVELEANLFRYRFYPEAFMVNNAFCKF